MAELQRWTRADNYIGDDLSAYYVGPSYNRDSDCIDISNFHAALEELGGEGDGVEIHSFTHWGCGWFECILVHESAKDKLEILSDIGDKLEGYPILDEDDYYRRVAELAWESWEDWGVGEVRQALGLEDDLTPEQSKKLYAHLGTNGLLEEDGAEGLHIDTDRIEKDKAAILSVVS